MNVFPLDVHAQNDKIYIKVKDVSLEKTSVLTLAFDNYLTVYPVITLSDPRIKRTETITMQHAGKSLMCTRIYTTSHQAAKDVAQTCSARSDVEYVFDADVAVARKFLLKHNLTLLRAHELVIENDILVSVTPSQRWCNFSDLSVLSFDIETYTSTKAINTKVNPVLSIGVWLRSPSKSESLVFSWSSVPTKHEYHLRYGTEKDMLEAFLSHVMQWQPDIICGYNSDSFDLTYLIDRAKLLGVSLVFPPLNLAAYLLGRAVHIPLVAHIDVFNFIRINLRSQLKTPSLSLGSVSQELLGEKKHEVDIFDLSRVWDQKLAEELDTFIAYNLQDAKLCFGLLEKIYPNILEFARLMYMSLDDITRSSYSQLVEGFLMSRAVEHGIAIAPKPAGNQIQDRLSLPENEGAFVFTPTPGFYKNIVVFDFRSLYPSLIASLNLAHDSLRTTPSDGALKVPETALSLYFLSEPKGFIPRFIEEIIVRRTSLKDEIRSASGSDKLLLEARSYNLKILANSLYGYLSFAYARWYCKEAGAATTAYARSYIKKTIAAATSAGFTVIYGDTDSLFLALGKKTVQEAKAFVATYNQTLPGVMKLQFEDEFESGIFVAAKGKEGGAKKRYALYAASGKFKIAGFEYVRGDWSDYARETQKEVLNLILAKHDPTQAFAYAKERIAQLRARKVPLLSLIIRDKLSRDLQEYTTNLPHVVAAKKLVQKGEVVGRGSTIPYVITQGKGHLYERVALIDEASLADIDVEYYVQNQVIPVVNSILEVFHLPCAELLSNVRQPSLNQFF